MVMLRHYCIIGLLSFHRFICSFIFISQLNTVNGLLSFLTTGHNKIQFPSQYWAMKCATRFNKTLNIKQERNRIEIENATVCLYSGGECGHRPSGEPTSEFQRLGPVRPPACPRVMQKHHNQWLPQNEPLSGDSGRYMSISILPPEPSHPNREATHTQPRTQE